MGQYPQYLESKLYPARFDRQVLDDIFTPGVRASGDLVATAGGSRTVSVGAGAAYMPGTQSANQGAYRMLFDAAVLNIAPCSVNPRLDQIIARIYDAEESGSLNQGVLEVLAGAEASGATLINRSGAAVSLPDNSIRLYDVLAPVGSGSLSLGNVADRRTYIGLKASPPPSLLNPVQVSGAYTAANGELVEYVGSSAVTITAPPQVAGNFFGVMAGSTTFSTTPITINFGSGNWFGNGAPAGLSTMKLGHPGACAIFVNDAASGSWLLVGGEPDSGWSTPLTWANFISSTIRWRTRGDRVWLSGSAQAQAGNAGFGGTLPAPPSGADKILSPNGADYAIVQNATGTLTGPVVTTGASLSFEGLSYSLT